MVVDDANQVRTGFGGSPRQGAIRHVADANQRAAIEPEDPPDIRGHARLQGDLLLRGRTAQGWLILPSGSRVRRIPL